MLKLASAHTMSRIRSCVVGVMCAIAVASSVGGSANAARVTFEYDDSGRLKKETYPDTSTKEYKLDAAGNRTQVQAIVPTSGVIAFTVQSYTVSEGVGTLQLSVGRTGTVIAGAGVTYTAANGTAVSGSDFTAATGTLSWVGTDVTPKTITLTITNDAAPEATEQFVVNLSAPTGGAVLGSATQATITINDNDAPTFSIANQSVNESAGTATFTVTLSPTSSLAYAVNYASANGTATAGSDYTGVSGALNFAANQSSQTITVPITPDSIYEGNETFTVGLSGPTNGALLGTATATGTITNDDTAPSFAINDVSVDEAVTSMTFTVTKTGNTALTHAVSYATANGTASAGSDYTAAASSVSFLPGDLTKTITVALADDPTYEGNEAFTVNLSSATAGATIADSQGVGTIVENDSVPPSGTLQFTTTTAAVTEGAANVTVTVSRINGSFGAASAVCGTVNGLATAGSDFTAIATTLNWAAGDATSKSCVVPIGDGDITFEGAENFGITLSGAVGATLGTPTSVNVMITDNDAPPSFSISATPSVTEGGVITYTVTKTGLAAFTHAVNYGAANGTAVAGSDFTLAPAQLVFQPADVTKTFTVTTTQEAIYENNETFTVSLSAPTNSATLGTSSVTTTINNDDAGPSFSIDDVSVNENGSTVLFTVYKTGPTEVAHTVNYATSNSSAIAGTDYTAASGTLNFSPSTTAQSIAVAISDDGTYEPLEWFYMNLSAPTAGATISHSQASGAILDNDPTPPTGSIQFTTSAVSVTEGAASVVLTLSRINGSFGEVSTSCLTQDVSATAGGDYVATSAPVTWANGDASDKTCTIPLNDDAVYEGNESFQVLRTNVIGADLGTPYYVTVTIVDNETTSLNDPPVWTSYQECIFPGGFCTNPQYVSGVLTWSSVPNATYYELEEQIDRIWEGTTPFRVVQSSASTSFNWTIQGDGVEYRVRACNANACSAFSPLVVFYVYQGGF